MEGRLDMLLEVAKPLDLDHTEVEGRPQVLHQDLRQVLSAPFSELCSSRPSQHSGGAGERASFF